MVTPARQTAGRTRPVARIALAPEIAEALERRAKRNDRFGWLEANRIIREALVASGDLPAETPDAR